MLAVLTAGVAADAAAGGEACSRQLAASSGASQIRFRSLLKNPPFPSALGPPGRGTSAESLQRTAASAASADRRLRIGSFLVKYSVLGALLASGARDSSRPLRDPVRPRSGRNG